MCMFRNWASSLMKGSTYRFPINAIMCPSQSHSASFRPDVGWPSETHCRFFFLLPWKLSLDSCWFITMGRPLCQEDGSMIRLLQHASDSLYTFWSHWIDNAASSSYCIVMYVSIAMVVSFDCFWNMFTGHQIEWWTVIIKLFIILAFSPHITFSIKPILDCSPLACSSSTWILMFERNVATIFRVASFNSVVSIYQIASHHSTEGHSLENLFWQETVHYLADERTNALAAMVMCDSLHIRHFSLKYKTRDTITVIFWKGLLLFRDSVYAAMAQSSRSMCWNYLHGDITIMPWWSCILEV
jgi:hypothetical protein